MHLYSTYILHCSDDSYYVGVTNDLQTRIIQHQLGVSATSYTYGRRPVELVFYEEYQWIQDAIAREKQLKGWSRKKKEALISGNNDLLPVLAKKVWRRE
ncbi:MAG: GIY-YIG nuclease family protein [Bacteroidetes bacterium]|nr:MAG: GIY-YIG nuclease family protein [Bacteroidota bacterium]